MKNVFPSFSGLDLAKEVLLPSRNRHFHVLRYLVFFVVYLAFSPASNEDLCN